MPRPGTEKTLTVDANVIHLYMLYLNRSSLPSGQAVKSMGPFSNRVLEDHSIAFNECIRTEYEETVGVEFTKNLLAKRLQKDLAVHVEPCSLSRETRRCLRDDYGFDCRSRDATYIETCLNTIFKHLITENTQHFHRPHKGSRKRRSMPRYLQRELGMRICTIDECCHALL